MEASKECSASGKILFIGGPLDNQVRDVTPWRTFLWLPCPSGEHHAYRLEKCRGAGYEEPSVFFVYAHGTLSTGDVQAQIYPPAVLECPRFGISLVALATVCRKYAQAPR